MHGHAARAILWRENALHLAAFACRVEDLFDGAGDHALACAARGLLIEENATSDFSCELA
jgi:hypothetical protein